MSEYSAEDQARDEAWSAEIDAVLVRGGTPSVTFTCQCCGNVGTIWDFHEIPPSHTESGLPICDECVFNPPAAHNSHHPFGQLLQFAGRDE